MASKVTCRPYRAGDEQGILSLYHSVFNLDLSLQMWRWMYKQIPEGPAIIVVAEHDESIVGHYAVQPRPFWLFGTPCLAGLAVGTMVHPSARNLTTLVQMANLAYDMCRGRELSFLYAFPNDAAWRIRQAVLGWQPLPELTEWEGPWRSLEKASGARIQTWHALPFEEDQLPFQIDAVGHNAISGRRTAAWLRWRFCQKPDAEYGLHVSGSPDNIEGYAVTKQYSRGDIRYGHIVDWQVAAESAATAREIFASLWQQFAAWGVKRVSCWALPQSSLCAYLQTAGLAPTGLKTNFCYLNISTGKEITLASSDAWNVQMADSDVY